MRHDFQARSGGADCPEHRIHLRPTAAAEEGYREDRVHGRSISKTGDQCEFRAIPKEERAEILPPVHVRPNHTMHEARVGLQQRRPGHGGRQTIPDPFVVPDVPVERRYPQSSHCLREISLCVIVGNGGETSGPDVGRRRVPHAERGRRADVA